MSDFRQVEVVQADFNCQTSLSESESSGSISDFSENMLENDTNSNDGHSIERDNALIFDNEII